jgi:hypothetical protein
MGKMEYHRVLCSNYSNILQSSVTIYTKLQQEGVRQWNIGTVSITGRVEVFNNSESKTLQ